MSTANPLVAAPVDTATPFSGAGLLDSGSQLVSAIESGDWAQGAMAGVGVALDTAATVIDPLGSLISAGLGWLIDHLEPLKGWFNDFTGDAGEVAAFGQTWANIQSQLQTSGQELSRIVGDVDELAGEAMDAYRRFQAESAQHINAAASWAGAMSTGLQIASTIVQIVHDLVRDVLSQLVGSIISWAAEAVFTLGLATPVIVGQVSTRVASLSAKVGKYVTDAISSCKSLSKLLDELTALLREAGTLFDGVLKGGDTVPHRPVDGADVPPKPARTPDQESAGGSPHVDEGGHIDAPPIPLADRPLDVSDPASVRAHSVHNPDSPSAMLGKWDKDNPDLRYTSIAERDGHSYFSIAEWDDVKQAQHLDDSEMFDAYNVPFLESQAAAQKPFHFSHPPVDDGSALGNELRWLNSHGYAYDPETMTAVYVGN